MEGPEVFALPHPVHWQVACSPEDLDPSPHPLETRSATWAMSRGTPLREAPQQERGAVSGTHTPWVPVEQGRGHIHHLVRRPLLQGRAELHGAGVSLCRPVHALVTPVCSSASQSGFLAKVPAGTDQVCRCCSCGLETCAPEFPAQGHLAVSSLSGGAPGESEEVD